METMVQDGEDGADGASEDDIADIFRTIPITSFGQSNKRIFKIAKSCKALLKTADPPPIVQAMAKEHWRHHQACMKRTWLEYWIEFCRSWRNAKDGRGELAVAAHVAKTMPTPPLIAEASDGEDNDSSLAWLANLMIVLQIQAGSDPIWLDQREAGVVLGGLSRQRVGQLIAVLRELGGVERTYKGHTKRASEYRVFMEPATRDADTAIAE